MTVVAVRGRSAVGWIGAATAFAVNTGSGAPCLFPIETTTNTGTTVPGTVAFDRLHVADLRRDLLPGIDQRPSGALDSRAP